MPRHLWLGLLTFGLLIGALACAHTSQTPFHYDEQGQPSAFKRRERNITRDLIHHISRDAYRRPNSDFVATLSPDQQSIFDIIGPPDWIRRPFTSFENETVHEWVYLDRAKVYQFIDGQMIFEGPLTDYEQILLQHGYPDRALVTYEESGRVDVFIYAGMFRPALGQFHFVNDKLTERQEGL